MVNKEKGNEKHEVIEMSVQSFCPVPGLNRRSSGFLSRKDLETMDEQVFLREVEKALRDESIHDQEILDAVELFYRMHDSKRVETMLGLFKYSLAHRFTYRFQEKK